MKLIDPIAGATILDGGPTVSKSEVIGQLLQHLASTGHIPATDIPTLKEAILRREALASTGIGQGIGVPHARHASIDRMLVLFATCRVPVNFDSIDAEPTDLFVLCLSPYEIPGTTLRVSPWSQLLLRRLADQVFCDRLRAATSPEELWACLVDAEDMHWY